MKLFKIVLTPNTLSDNVLLKLTVKFMPMTIISAPRFQNGRSRRERSIHEEAVQ